MSTARPKVREFQAQIHLHLEVGVAISADSLENATAKAKALKVSDLIDFKALGLDYNDSKDPAVVGVWEYVPL